MHFRVRPRSIQVIRTVVDPVTKRPKGKVLGRVDRSELEVPQKLKDSCSEEELVELMAWVEQFKRTENVKLEAAARGLSEQIELADQWLASAVSDQDAKIIALNLLGSLSRLRNTVRKLTANG